MDKQRGEASSSGIGVLGLLGVVFVVLKLTGVIDWSWWWVTAPFWGGFALLGALMLLALLLAFFAEMSAKKRR